MIYFWGRQSESPRTIQSRNETTSPTATPLKSGSTSTMNLSRSQSSSTVTSSRSDNPSMVIFSGVEKSGSPLKISMISEDGWIKIMKDMSPEIYRRIQAVTKISKFARELKNVSRKLISINMDEHIKKLILNLIEKISSWYEIQSRLSADFLRSFCTYGETKFNFENFKFCSFKDLCRAILELHFAYVDAIGFRCFSHIKLE